MSSKRTLENTISLVLVQLVNLTLPLIALPYLARILGADSLGNIVFAMALAQIFLILSDYGFNLSAAKDVALNRDDLAKTFNIWSSVTIIRSILACIGFIILVILIFIFDRLSENMWLYLLAYISVIGNVIYPQWLFQGLEQLKFVSFIQIICRILLFSLLILFVKSEVDIYFAIVIQSAGGLIAGLIVLPKIYKIFKDCKKVLPSINDLKNQLKSGWVIFIPNIFGNLYLSCNAFFLGLIVSPAQVANYHVAEKLIRAAVSVCSPISNAIFPKMVRMFQNSSNEALLLSMKIIIILLTIFLAGSLFTYFSAEYFVDLIFGKDFIQAGLLLKIFSPLPVLVVLAIVLGNLIMIPAGMEKYFSKIIMIASVLNIFIFLIFTHLFNNIGAVVANLFVEIVVVSSMLYVLIRKNINPFNFWKLALNDMLKKVIK